MNTHTKMHIIPNNDGLGMFTWGFTPGYHMTGLQPSEQCRIVSELDAFQPPVCAFPAWRGAKGGVSRGNWANQRSFNGSFLRP